MKLTYYVIIIDTNRYSVDVKRFFYILDQFHVIFATYRGGICKALCEDTVDMKLYAIYQTENAGRYDSCIIERQSDRDEIRDLYQLYVLIRCVQLLYTALM